VKKGLFFFGKMRHNTLVEAKEKEMTAQLVSTIRNGYLIKTETETFVVAGALKIRNSYKYICKTSDGRTIAIDRKDVLEAQRDGSAVVLAAQ